MVAEGILALSNEVLKSFDNETNNDKNILTNDKHQNYDGIMTNLKSPLRKRSSTLFLQIVIVLIGIGTLALLLWEPWIEGVNANAVSLYDIYFDDPFLALAYIGSIPFFIALYQAIKLLGYAGKTTVFSVAAVKALKTIKHCAIAIIGFVAVEEIFILLNHGSDDAAGGVFMGILFTFGSIVIATAAAVFEKTLQNAVDIKSENDLTV